MKSPTTLVSFVFFLLPSLAFADVLLTTKGQRVENIRVRTFGVEDEDDESYEFDIELIQNGKLTGEHKLFPEEDVQSIEFREPEDPPTKLGRVAHIQGHVGDPLNHMIVERADRAPEEGLVFRVRKSSEPQGSKVRRAKVDDIYMMTFSPSMMESAATASTRSGAAPATPAKTFMVRGPFPVLEYVMTVIVSLCVAAGFVFLHLRKKKAS